MPSTTTATEKIERTAAVIDQEIHRLNGQYPALQQQMADATRLVKETEAKLGDLFVRSLLCEESQRPKAEIVALEAERQQALAHTVTLDRALKQFHSTIQKLEAEKQSLLRAGKAAERETVLTEQRILAKKLDAVLTKTVLPQFLEFLQGENRLYGLSTDIGIPAGQTPRTKLMRIIQTYFATHLHPAMERPSITMSFAESVPKQ